MANQQLQDFTSNKKRLLSGCPNPNAGNQPLTTPADYIIKKTRDLPNLSECQACGFRIDRCVGKNRIELLSSEWRIVLLCDKCLSRVECSKICSYCFKESKKDVFNCRLCKRSIHRNCYVKYKSVPPWSYSCSGPDLSVCVDCWLPESKMKQRGFVLRSEKDVKDCAKCEDSKTRVSNSCSLNGEMCLDNSGVERKFVLALAAGRMSRGKHFAVKRPNSSLDLGEIKDEGSGNDKEAVDDVELAIQLHRVINSSPRISWNSVAANSNCSIAPKTQELFVKLVNRGSDSGNPSVHDVGSDVESDKRSSDSSDNMDVASNGVNNSLILEPQSFNDDELKSAKIDIETCKKTDRYLLKYRRRKSSFKIDLASPKSMALASVVTLNCPRETRTTPDASIQSCDFPG